MAGLAAAGGWELGIGEDRRVSAVRLEAEGQAAGHPASAGPVLDTGRWYFAAASWDAGGAVSLLVLPRGGGPGGSRGPAGPGRAEPHDLGGPIPAARVISVGAVVSGRNVRRCFNGKIDTPRVFEGTPSGSDLAALAADAPAARVRGLRHEWRFTPGAALPPHRVRDTGPGRCDGTLVNSPVLGVTGRNWTPGTESFRVRPDEYAAATFHEDDLADAGWETSLSFRVPAEWPSGAYGVRLRAGGHDGARGDGDQEDVVPVIVSAAGTRRPGGQPRRCSCRPSATWPTRTSMPPGSTPSARRVMLPPCRSPTVTGSWPSGGC